MAGNWSDDENDLIVADYFDMLSKDLARVPYVKSHHRAALKARLGRSDGSIEFKHQNVSAVLRMLGEPWITGYRPADNFQSSLIAAVERWLASHTGWLAAAAAPVTPDGAGEGAVLAYGPPPSRRNEPPPANLAAIQALARRHGVPERDARNKALGDAGEALVLRSERAILRAGGRGDLAERVAWTAREEGDGAGYDVASWDLRGAPRLLEVKTTNGWDRTPFHISANELRVADERREHWRLIRVHGFARRPQAFEIAPPLERTVDLTPTEFRAAFP